VLTTDLAVPERVLAVGAHPDDIEFGCGATIAKWADAGATIHCCICTDGSKGSWDPDADPGALVATRIAEQEDAAAVLGVKAVEFLGYVDGELDDALDAREAVAAVIRRTRPDVVFTHDPAPIARIHPDHRRAGYLVLDAIVAARDPLFFPEQGLEPHRPSLVLLFESEQPDHVERIDATVDRKIASLLRHRSQWRSTMHIDDRPEEQHAAFVREVRDTAAAHGLRAGVRTGEAFRRFTDL